VLVKVNECLNFGVRYVWVTRRIHIHNCNGVHEVRCGMLWTSDPEILVPIDQLFD
jgi:hypothetical protein